MKTRQPGHKLFSVLGLAALAMMAWDGTSSAAAAEVADGFETIPPDEAAAIDELSRLATSLQDKRVDPVLQPELLRGVHPKSHGCVRAQLTVDTDLDESLRVGLFVTPGQTFDAWIRYSNASVLVADDLQAPKPDEMPDARENGSRGMALKVLDVEGNMLLTDDGRANQDFLMINTPEFAFANVRDYLRLNRVLMLSERGDSGDAFFLPLSLPAGTHPASVAPTPELRDIFSDFLDDDGARTRRSFAVIQKIKDRVVRNPLQVQYFGAAPFGFGAERAMKFSAKPCADHEQFAFGRIVEEDPSRNYLGEALTETMRGEEDICFDFMIQLRGAGDLEVEHMEDATTTWPDEEASYARVAQITIPAPQEPEAPDVVAECEALAFSPWHALAAHRPLGGINRLRQQVYIESANHRGAAGYKK